VGYWIKAFGPNPILHSYSEAISNVRFGNGQYLKTQKNYLELIDTKTGDKTYLIPTVPVFGVYIGFPPEINRSIYSINEGEKMIVNSIEYNTWINIESTSGYEVISNGFNYEKRGEMIRILDNPNELDLLVYPNPATDFINIEKEAELYSLQGEIIMKLDKGKNNIESIPSGFYLIRSSNTVTRLIKKNN